ncbi:MAG: 2-oxoacid:ferredoxin oxidoreductase subunit beta [Candidatus Micrarchaeia archaeon]
MASINDLAEPEHTITWCPGCGNYAILAALKKAIIDCGLEPHQTVVSSGVGCCSKLPHFIKTYGYEGLHGREVAAASGTKLANHELEVIALGGDGDGLGIGVGHFVHACRRNYDMTYIVHDNHIYGLTTGQTSPTSEQGFKSKSTPDGALEIPINPISLAIDSGATFVARGFSGELVHLSKLIAAGIKHKGFAFIDVMQPCVVWNKINTFEYYKQKCYKLDEDKKYDSTNKMMALAKAQEWETKIPIGVIYQQDRPTYEDGLPMLGKGPLSKLPIDNVDMSGLLKEYE